MVNLEIDRAIGCSMFTLNVALVHTVLVRFAVHRTTVYPSVHSQVTTLVSALYDSRYRN